jgi:hypothetical protein
VAIASIITARVDGRILVGTDTTLEW